MNRFYKVAIDKRPIGTAFEHREPPLQGAQVTKVADSRTQGSFKLIVVDATDTEHQANLALPGVDELAQAAAVALAAEYQPEVTREVRDRETENVREVKVKKVKVPAVDLKDILRRRQGAQKTVKKRKSTRRRIRK